MRRNNLSQQKCQTGHILVRVVMNCMSMNRTGVTAWCNARALCQNGGFFDMISREYPNEWVLLYADELYAECGL